MQEPVTTTERETHKKLAVDLFNLAWQLMDKKNRTKEENDRMIHAAHASRFHWGAVGTPKNFERGEWQISRVYTLLGRAEPALYHARRCLEICQENKIGDWDIAFAYEAMARAHAVSGDNEQCKKHAIMAEKAGNQIKEKEDRDLFFGELKSLPC